MNQTDRTPPQSLDVERTVLGSMLIDLNATATAIELLVANSFYSSTNRHIFSVMSEMFEKNIPIDTVTICDEFKKKNMSHVIDDGLYIFELAESIATTGNIEYYCGILNEKMVLRDLISVAGEITTTCFYPEATGAGTVELAESKIFAISDRSVKSEIESAGKLMPKFFKEVENFSKGQQTGVKTGFYELDEATCGLQKSDLVIIAGRPSMGKTAFALAIAQNAALQYGEQVLIFSLEMSKAQLIQRMVCSEARVNMHSLRKGTLPKREFPKLSMAAGPIAEAGIHIDDAPYAVVSSIRSKARRQKKQHGLSLIIIDYLQLMGGTSKENRQQEITAISRGLKCVAKELDVPVVALSQLSRAVELRVGNKRPQLSDLRESGAIEQDADVVMFVYRDEVYNKDDESNRGKAEIIIAKQRNGPLETAHIAFLKDYARFENMAVQPIDDLEVFRG